MEARLGLYTVLKHLASGGMADVLLARSNGIEGFHRHVVLKRIRPEHARDPRFVRMFLDEARLAATLHHQNIVQVHDVGEHAGEYFLAMEYIHGEDLRTVLAAASRARQHVPLAHVLAIVADAAAGLHYAHERRGADGKPLGIVHRDVSPSNLIVGYDGGVKVVDFGIAKASAQEETRSGGLRGKVSYMSPEQCKGERVDRRSDVYALGVLLYELATTTRLFKGDSDYKIMEAIVNGRVPAPRTKRPDLPEELAAIALRAVSLDPARRYATAHELRVALDHLARKLGQASSHTALAAYMRMQFGDPPEPWVDLDGSADVLEQPRPTEARNPTFEMASSSASMPRQTGPMPTGASGEAPPLSRPASTESWPAPPETRQTSVKRALWIAIPALGAVGVALWLLAGRTHDEPARVAFGPVPRAAPSVTPSSPVTPTARPSTASVSAHMPSFDVDPQPDPRTRARQAPAPRRIAAARPEDAGPAAAPPDPDAPAPSQTLLAPATTPTMPPPAVTAAVLVPSASVANPPPASVNVASLDAVRIAGDRLIHPDDATAIEIRRRGLDRLVGMFKICLSTNGSIITVSALKTTGFPDYDSKITTTIRNSWRYKPYLVSGSPSPVCTAVRLIYNQ